MQKWCLFLLLAIITNEALGFSYRYKRQAKSREPTAYEVLETKFEGNTLRFGQGHRRFPDQGLFTGLEQFPGLGQFPGHGQFPEQRQGQNPTSTPNAVTGTDLLKRPTTQSSAFQQECIRNCPVTSEYNPVCGSNGIMYVNPGRLACVQSCGVTMNIRRYSRCPNTIQAN